MAKCDKTRYEQKVRKILTFVYKGNATEFAYQNVENQYSKRPIISLSTISSGWKCGAKHIWYNTFADLGINTNTLFGYSDFVDFPVGFW